MDTYERVHATYGSSAQGTSTIPLPPFQPTTCQPVQHTLLHTCTHTSMHTHCRCVRRSAPQIGPGLESALEDSEKAVRLASCATGDVEVLRAASAKSNKKVQLSVCACVCICLRVCAHAHVRV